MPAITFLPSRLTLASRRRKTETEVHDGILRIHENEPDPSAWALYDMFF
tara:strand:- start:285 stop:431 length:147 start_codon:yes stop_codon:yes gene_type:complete